MPRNREQEAGALYEEGARHVRAGGHDLYMVAAHLIHMIDGTKDHPGALWPARVLHDGREIRLDRFADYLSKPVREGLGLPSFYFLRQVLDATPDRGQTAIVAVRKELAKEFINFDVIADQEHATELLKGKLQAPHRPPVSKEGVVSTPLPKGDSTARRAAQLAARRPDLKAAVEAGTLKLSKALLEAGIRKPPKPRLTHCPHCGGEL